MRFAIRSHQHNRLKIMDTSSAICPNCQATLPKKPLRKTRCPSCGEYIFVRTISDQTVLFTPAQLEKYEQERQEQFSAQSHANHISEILRLGSISESAYLKEKSNFESKSGAMSGEDELRFAWQIAKRQAARQMQAGGSPDYYQMAIFASRRNWEYRSLLEIAAQKTLLGLKNMGVTHVQISTCGDKSCPSCQKLENKKLTIEDALQRKLLPHKDCTYVLFGNQPGFCRCEYLAAEISYASTSKPQKSAKKKKPKGCFMLLLAVLLIAIFILI